MEQAARQFLADELERPASLLLAAAEQGVDDLEEQILQEIGVFLVGARE